LRARTMLISSPTFRSLRPRLYPSDRPVSFRLGLSASRRWRADDHSVHTHASPDRES
jgi:hypothetical protein